MKYILGICAGIGGWMAMSHFNLSYAWVALIALPMIVVTKVK